MNGTRTRAGPAEGRNPRRWLPALAAFVVGAIAYAGLYCFPPISVAYASEFGIGRTLAVVPWTIFLLVTGLSSPLLGRAYDAIADRWLLSAGMLLMAIGWAMAALTSGVALLVVAYGIFLAIGLELVFVGTTTAMARRYAGMTGLALGIAYAGPGAGVAVALPLVTPAIAAIGWREILAVFGVLSLAGLPFVWLMTSGPAILVPLRTTRRAGAARAPEAATAHARAMPEGGHAATETPGLHETSVPGAVGAAREVAPFGDQGRDDTLRRTLHTARFWALFAGAVAIGVMDEGVFQTFLPQATRQGVPEALAAQGLAIESVSYILGQLVGGALSDRLGRRSVGAAALLIVALGASMAFAATGATAELAVAGVALNGFGMGATIAVRSAAFSDVFGGANFGAIFGVLAVAYPLGGILPVELGGISVDRLGTYWPVYWLVMAAVVVWGVALLVAGPRRHGRALRARLRGAIGRA
ncbi:MAG: MFS transporter [Candidatus Limnocylindrales bacterium]